MNCELCGNDLRKGTSEVIIREGMELVRITGNIYRCSFCGHTETFVDGLRVLNPHVKSVYGAFQ